MTLRDSIFLWIPLLLAPGGTAFGQPAAHETPKMLLGSCTQDSLEQKPYADWFRKGYDAYEPRPETLAALEKSRIDDAHITVFFGSWCGDSKREVPRFLKCLDALHFPPDHLTLIAVSNEDSSLKQSPGGEERGKNIYRVPTFIVSRNGTEVNRIVEYPVLSLERDLFQIVSGGSYSPNYRSFPTLARWLDEGILDDDNVSHRGLANQIRADVSSEGELNAFGYVLLGRGATRAAVTVFQMNCDLYPESANRRFALARGLHRHGNDDQARHALQRALELNDDPERLAPMLEFLATLQPESTKGESPD